MQVLLDEAFGGAISVRIVLFKISTLLDFVVNLVAISMIFMGHIGIDLFMDVANIEATILGVETEFLKNTLKVLVNKRSIFKIPFLEFLNSFS